jgi:hypothetical protein
MLEAHTCKADALIGAVIPRTGAQGSGWGQIFFFRLRDL